MRYIFAIFLFTSCTISTLFCCTDFQLTARDGTIVNGRSMEFAMPLQTQVTIQARDECWQSRAPNKEPGFAWASIYGFVAASCLEGRFVTDGLNEKGLSVGLLWLPGSKYEEPSPDAFSHTMVIEDVGAWLLGVCATVDEVIKTLPQVTVWGHALSDIGLPPLHLTIHDASGDNLVVEFVNGKQRMYKNPNGVLTNAPTFDWHIMNLRNFVNLTPMDADTLHLDGMAIPEVGHGSGMLGLPGDSTPPSRFVKMTLLKNAAEKPKDAAGGVTLAEHLLNTVDIPFGTSRATNEEKSWEYTQWSVVKDLTNKIFYYKTYENQEKRLIDLKRINFSQEGTSFVME